MRPRITNTTKCFSLFLFCLYRFHLSHHLITFRNLDDITHFLELVKDNLLNLALTHHYVYQINKVCTLKILIYLYRSFFNIKGIDMKCTVFYNRNICWPQVSQSKATNGQDSRQYHFNNRILQDNT